MTTSSATEPGQPSDLAQSALPQSISQRYIARVPLWGGLGLVVLLVSVWFLQPTIVWVYDLEQAGQLIERGLAWPNPRQAASLPTVRDAQALDHALSYLEDAIRLRPNHPQAYRLSGQVYAAQNKWAQAATAFEQAHTLAPQNPLYSWETSLIYQEMQQIVKQAPHESIMETMSAGHLIAPGQLIKSLFCNDQGAESCYFGSTTYTQAYAAFPDQPAVSIPVLFLHPPASLEQTLTISREYPALHFVVGLDPVAREWRTNGATFHIWVKDATGQRKLVSELNLDRETAQQGWVPGWADLSAWAGQRVTIELESNAGPLSDLNDDWYGWGDLSFTTIDSAFYATLLPAQQQRQLRASMR